MKRKFILISISIIIGSLIFGCSVPASHFREILYYPKELEGSPREDVITLRLSGYEVGDVVRKIKIDDVSVPYAWRYVLSLGVHTIEFDELGPSPTYVALAKLMENKGYTPTGDGKFSKYENGQVLIVKPVGLSSRNRWNSRKIRFCTKPEWHYMFLKHQGEFVVLSDGHDWSNAAC